jgi:hypothetical protein
MHIYVYKSNYRGGRVQHSVHPSTIVIKHEYIYIQSTSIGTHTSEYKYTHAHEQLRGTHE